jgi:PTS system nitrogen regulatory IIA component
MPMMSFADYLREDFVFWDLPCQDKPGGLALPHATLAGLEQPLLVVGRTREGVDFAALDSRPVDLFFLLLSPPGAQAQQLRVLARLARIFAPEERVERLRSATGPEALFQMLLEEDARHVY